VGIVRFDAGLDRQTVTGHGKSGRRSHFPGTRQARENQCMRNCGLPQEGVQYGERLFLADN